MRAAHYSAGACPRPTACLGASQTAWSGGAHFMCRRAASTAAAAEDEVRARLRAVAEPDLGLDVVALGFVQRVAVTGANVSVDLVLNTPACPTREALVEACRSAVAALPWVETIEVHVSFMPRAKRRQDPKTQASASSGLKDVKRIVAVSSAKGGVGKSTVSVNLAFAIAQLGGRVGIFDADLQGPSLPTMCAIDSPKVRKSPNSDTLMEPLEYEGVKLMSYGFSAKAQQGKAAVMRGPMVASTVSNLVKSTDWGDLDYLILDFPPGTGDIQLTLCQELALDGAVIVTTPQRLSFVDVVKGLDMFDSLHVPIVGLVQNMSFFDCDAGKRYRPFGDSRNTAELASLYGIPPVVEFPIRAQVSQCGDSGRPLVLEPEGGDQQVSTLFSRLAASVVQQLTKVRRCDMFFLREAL